MTHHHPGLKLKSGILHNVTFFPTFLWLLCIIRAGIIVTTHPLYTLHTQSPVPHHSRRCACLITLFHMPHWYPWWRVAVSIWLWITLPVSSPIASGPDGPQRLWVAPGPSPPHPGPPPDHLLPLLQLPITEDKKINLLSPIGTSSTSYPVQQPSFPPLAHDLSYSGTSMLIAKVFPLCTV